MSNRLTPPVSTQADERGKIDPVDPGNGRSNLRAENLPLVDALSDLVDRMDRAEVALLDMAGEHKPLSHDAIRLTAKANGVALARGYVADALRWIRGE
jgi:hypothetical protein